MRRVAATLLGCLWAVLATTAPSYAPVVPGRALVFPADYGSHPDFRTEWWYVTGWLKTVSGEDLGFQITFFRTKPNIDENNPSSFAPKQLLIAHCAISDPKRGRLWQDQKIRREGLGLAEATAGDTNIRVDDWALKREGSHYMAKIVAEDFAFELALSDTQPLMLNGVAGFSRKGEAADAASYYYSVPHMKVTGRIVRGGKRDTIDGEAWLDHEWSSEYLDTKAVGWDWIGINLNDGGTLMAFRIRGSDGKAHWAGGTLRTADGQVHILSPNDVEFRPGPRWISPRTGISYPVRWQIRAGDQEFALEPLIDDQENDTRLSTGAVYWEGAVSAYDSNGLRGRGYLELTGYGERLRLR